MSAGHGYRLPLGGSIDRGTELTFSFNGRRMIGYGGDTLASALIANGVSLIARSLKWHRPRGFFGACVEDPNSMLEVRDAHGCDPAIRAGQVRLVQGLQATTLSGWPSPDFDIGAVARLASGVLGAGFYYKTFKWPDWQWFEPVIRRMTGYGRAGRNIDERSVQHSHATCDVLVIGSGPSGLAVARALKDSGLRIVVAEQGHMLGGSCLWEQGQIDGQSSLSFRNRILAELEAAASVTLLPSTVVTGAYEGDMFTLVQTLHDSRGIRCERHWRLHATNVVLATGMIDRPLPFVNNDRPGIMLSSAVRRLIGQFAVAPARRLCIYTNNDSAYLTAMNARRAGMDVVAVVDTRPAAAAIHADPTGQLGIPLYFDSLIENTSGYRRLEAIQVRSGDGSRRELACDGLAISGGWVPTLHLAAHRGIKPVYDEARSMHICSSLPPGWFAIGGANGALDLEAAMDEAECAAEVIAAAHRVAPLRRRCHIEADSFGTVTPAWLPPSGPSTKIWIDLQNDVTAADIELAARENYVSIEHLKRYTTLGMGTDQGRTSNVNGLAMLASLTGRPIAEVGTTTFRPPFSSVRFSTIANARRGDLYQPRRRLPAEQVHREWGCVMEDSGWERPDWYRSNGPDRESAVAEEMRAVRESVGVFDSSSLGKIEITGPDAATFLARFYVSNMATLKPGRIRYSVMLREDGVIADDGVVACISPQHFLASPTSGNAATIAAWFERWRQTEWPSLRVAVSNATENWAALAIAGRAARRLLQRLDPDFDSSAGAFGHMEFRAGKLSGIPARVARVSFTGELQYEISVPSRYASSLMRALLTSSDGLTPRPVGLEAWLRLRLEKGYIHFGSETNGRTSPLDIGMAGIVARRSDDFIGKRSLSLPFATSPEREQLVGLIATHGALRAGGRIMVAGHSSAPCPTEGYVTSACFSPTLGESIGLALIERGHQREGDAVSVYCAGRIVLARICAPTFFDPKNERLHL